MRGDFFSFVMSAKARNCYHLINTHLLYINMKMLYMTVYAIRQGACVNNFAIEIAEINNEVKHLQTKTHFPTQFL